MLDVLRTDRATVKLSLVVDEMDLSGSKGIATASVNKFSYLRTKVKNQSGEPYSINLLRVNPTKFEDEALIISMNISISPAEFVLFDGTTSNVPVGRMDGGEERQIDFGICFVSEGSFDIRVTVGILVEKGAMDPRTGEGRLRVVVGE